jgi:hypothetical protein
MKKQLPVICPSCSTALKVQRLLCPGCSTAIEGSYDLAVIDYLKPEEQAFVLNFIKSSGSLKEMAQSLNLSYPSVRNMLDDLIKKINHLENEITTQTSNL